MNKRKLLLVALSLCMVAILAMGGTLAYLTDTDAKTNVFTVGNVNIEQNEKDREGNDYVNNQKLFPIVDDKKDDAGFHMGKNYVDKIVTVTVEKGSEDCYVRTFLAIPAKLDDGPLAFDASENILHWNGMSANDSFKAANMNMDNDWYWTPSWTNDWPVAGTFNGQQTKNWNGYYTEIDGVGYNVYVATHKGILSAQQTTAPTLLGVYLDQKVNSFIDDAGNTVFYYVDEAGEKIIIDFDLSKKFNILVKTEAVQAQGFEDAIYALDSAFGYVGEHDPFGGSNITVFPATVDATAAAKAAK